MDAKYFYAVNNRTITKHDRRTGAPLLQFAGDTDGPFKHMDSGVVVGSKLYAAHSSYQPYGQTYNTQIVKHPTFWAISRPNRLVHTFTMPLTSLQTPPAKGWQVLGPGEFRK